MHWRKWHNNPLLTESGLLQSLNEQDAQYRDYVGDDARVAFVECLATCDGYHKRTYGGTILRHATEVLEGEGWTLIGDALEGSSTHKLAVAAKWETLGYLWYAHDTRRSVVMKNKCKKSN